MIWEDLSDLNDFKVMKVSCFPLENSNNVTSYIKNQLRGSLYTNRTATEQTEELGKVPRRLRSFHAMMVQYELRRETRVI